MVPLQNLLESIKVIPHVPIHVGLCFSKRLSGFLPFDFKHYKAGVRVCGSFVLFTNQIWHYSSELLSLLLFPGSNSLLPNQKLSHLYHKCVRHGFVAEMTWETLTGDLFKEKDQKCSLVGSIP